MKTLAINEWIKIRKEFKKNSSIGFVPTMGNIHEGHESLILRSVKENDITVVSIFINPTQFDDKNDYENYPKTLDEDKKIIERCNADFIILPNYASLYPDNYSYKISENSLSEQFCGKYRKDHFAGVLTVVMKLFMIVMPQKAYFGEKDWQQLTLIKRMANAFFLDIEIVPCTTIRENNGLAMSSRNVRLTEEQKSLAANFPFLLKNKEMSCDEIKNELQNLGFLVDYIENYQGRRLGAVRIGNVRLIDNFAR